MYLITLSFLNIGDANTDNVVYQRCIMDYLRLDDRLRYIDDEYEREHTIFFDTFFR